jgi:hypothetical protein
MGSGREPNLRESSVSHIVGCVVADVEPHAKTPNCQERGVRLWEVHTSRLTSSASLAQRALFPLVHPLDLAGDLQVRRSLAETLLELRDLSSRESTSSALQAPARPLAREHLAPRRPRRGVDLQLPRERMQVLTLPADASPQSRSSIGSPHRTHLGPSPWSKSVSSPGKL